MTKSSSRSITTFASGILKRLAAVEHAAQQAHDDTQDSKIIARATLTSDGLHVLLQDQHGASLEIAGGQLAVAVKSGEAE